MNTLIIQNSFEPYYAGKRSFSAPCSEPAEGSGVAQQTRKSTLTKSQRLTQLQARLLAVRPLRKER